jgi:hypothetical protein
MYQEHVHNYNRKKTKKFKLREWHIPDEISSSTSVATVAYNLVQLYKSQVTPLKYSQLITRQPCNNSVINVVELAIIVR